MSDGGITLAIVMAAQAVVLALVSRVRWRCHEDGTCTSGCTEQSLVPSSDARCPPLMPSTARSWWSGTTSGS